MIINQRIRSIDLIRGLAIFMMIFGNLTPLLDEEAPVSFRLFISFAAPLFVILAGMMIAQAATSEKRRNKKYFVKRCFFLLIAAATVDALIWNIIPGTTVDVLYLIAVSVPIVYFVAPLHLISQTIIMSFFFAMTPFLQMWLGYTDYPLEYNLQGKLLAHIIHPTSIPHHWFVDGWFPIFPWIGFAIFGSLTERLWFNTPGRKIYHLGISILVVSIGGGVFWYLRPWTLLIRGGYQELFYPPGVGFIISSIGVFLLLWGLVAQVSNKLFIDPLVCVGEAALSFYLIHLLLIRYAIETLWPHFSLNQLSLTASLLFLLIVALGYSFRWIRKLWPTRHQIVKWLIG